MFINTALLTVAFACLAGLAAAAYALCPAIVGPALFGAGGLCVVGSVWMVAERWGSGRE